MPILNHVLEKEYQEQGHKFKFVLYQDGTGMVWNEDLDPDRRYQFYSKVGKPDLDASIMNSIQSILHNWPRWKQEVQARGYAGLPA